MEVFISGFQLHLESESRNTNADGKSPFHAISSTDQLDQRTILISISTHPLSVVDFSFLD